MIAIGSSTVKLRSTEFKWAIFQRKRGYTQGVESGAERRRSPRAATKAQVVQVEAEGQVDITLGHTRDVSVHGMYVEIQKQFNPAQDPEVDDQLKVRFRLPNTDEPIEAGSRVARVDKDEDERLLGFGLEFLEVSDADRGVIEAFVSAHLEV